MPELIDLQIPSLGESVSEATIAKWVKADGDYVKMDEVVAELETDKATVEMNAPKAGTLKIAAKKGDTVKVGDVIAKIDVAGKPGGASEGAKGGDGAKPAPAKAAPAPAGK